TDSLFGFVLPGFALHQELELLVAAGLSPAEALSAATRGPAELLGVLDERGTVEVGKIADLVLLEADPLADIRNTRRIVAVVDGGQVRSRADLDRMLSDSDADNEAKTP
ncbi:MAG: amidohydrolase family protein, partial [Acidobacteriota bacterium]